MRHKCTIYKLVLGGALIGGALFVSFNFAKSYDQQTTHPALTDEAVDFYNLNFPSNSLTQDDKKWLIKGAIDEDTPPRWFNHFYDPVYNQGWLGYTSSKEWAYSSEKQIVFLGGKSQTAGFAQMFIDNNLSPDDYSYQRALYDYAIGDRKRAMTAMGHIMHLLEDANVPDHTRNDTHLPWAGTESPYEKAMAKWNPGNLDIAGKIFANSAKPILLSGLGDYFDKIAKYSNGYFFSQDTINTLRYNRPNLSKTKKFFVNGEERLFAVGLDKNGQEFKLALLKTKLVRNLIEIKEATLINPDVGSIILDGYWSRLSKDFIPLGVGALKLFLGQAELVKSEYAKNQQVVQGPGLFGGVLSLLGISGQSEPQLTFDPTLINSILGGTVAAIDDVSVLPTPSVTPLTSLTPSPTPSATPLPSVTVTPTSSPSPSPTQLGGSSDGNNSGGNGQSNSQNSVFSSSPSPSPSPTPSPSATPSSTPSPTPTPSPSLIPSPSSSPSPSPTPTPKPVPPETKVVINEIAWMGTGSAASLSNDEWLELYNITSKSVDLSGWRLRSLTDNSPDITIATASIDSYGFFLLERTDDTTVSDILANQIYKGNLKDRDDDGKGGESLELRDNNDNLVDLVPASGSWFAGLKEGRYTMERIDPLKPGTDASNWASNNGTKRNGLNANDEPINGTPGVQNSVYMAENTTPTPTPSPGIIVWQFNVPDAGYISQPVAAKDGGTIYFGASTPETPTLGKVRFFAVNPDTVSPDSAEKWRFEEEHMGVPTTPAVSDDGAVYFGHPSSRVAALNPDGTLRWQFDTNGVNGVSVDEDGNVYFTSGGSTRMNEMVTKVGANGEKKWQTFGLFAFGFTPVTIASDEDDDVYLAADGATRLPEFYRLNGDDGTVIWHSGVSDGWAFDLVYDKETDQFYTATTAGHIISVNRSDGAIDSHLFAFGVPATTKVAVLSDLLVVGVDFSLQNPASGQAVIALNKTDKSKIWTFPVDSPVNKEIAVDADGNLYFSTRNGKVYSLDKDGKERWILDLGAPTELYPVLGENAVFMGVGGSSGGKLVKIADY